MKIGFSENIEIITKERNKWFLCYVLRLNVECLLFLQMFPTPAVITRIKRLHCSYIKPIHKNIFNTFPSLTIIIPAELLYKY